MTRVTALLVLCLAGCADAPAPGGDPARASATSVATMAAPPMESSPATSAATPSVASSAAEDGTSPPTAASTASSPRAPSTRAPEGTSPSAPPRAVASAPPATSTAPPAAAPAPPSETQGEVTKGPQFSAYLTGGTFEVGGGAVRAVIQALGEYHVNAEYPFKLTLDVAPAGITYAETTIRTVSRTEKTASMPVAFTASKPGTYRISGTCALSVCTPNECIIKKVPLASSITVR